MVYGDEQGEGSGVSKSKHQSNEEFMKFIKAINGGGMFFIGTVLSTSFLSYSLYKLPTTRAICIKLSLE